MTIHQDLARKIMADLRNRNELHKILAPTDPGDGTPWADLKQQTIMEERLAEIILAELVPIAAEMTELREKVETLREQLGEATVK